MLRRRINTQAGGRLLAASLIDYGDLRLALPLFFFFFGSAAERSIPEPPIAVPFPLLAAVTLQYLPPLSQMNSEAIETLRLFFSRGGGKGVSREQVLG